MIVIVIINYLNPEMLISNIDVHIVLNIDELCIINNDN